MASDQNTNYPLTSLYLYLTEQCNLSCTHCWISPGFSLEQQRGISLDAIKKTILEAKTLGLQTVKLTGGEPLLYGKLKELVKFLASENLTIYIETNGTLFDQALPASFQSANVAQISISLDAATETVHDDIRGVRGCFQRTMDGLNLLADCGLNFQIIMTLQRKNSGEIPSLIQLCEKLGASSLKINHLLPCGRAKKAFTRQENLKLEELIDLYQEVEAKWLPSNSLEIIFDLPLAFRSIEDIKHGKIKACQILNILAVLANGDFSICGIGQSIKELRMGNLYSDSIKKVWQKSPILKQLRQSLPVKLKAPCGKCIFRFQCLGACRANAYTLTKDFCAPYFLCQNFFESGRFPSSRYVA
jgi:SynChlorMet cassette radical SAM/SPASM protein ScmF